MKLAICDVRTMAGKVSEEFWWGIEVDGPVPLEFLSWHGYDLIPADAMTRDELASVGVATFEELPAWVDAGLET